MTDGKMLGILDNLKDKYKREAKDKEDKEILSALEMAVEYLTKTVDLNNHLNNQCDDLKRQISILDEELTKAKEEITIMKEQSLAIGVENGKLNTECNTYRDCISLMCREVLR